ncbi:MAG: AraC family transcriptional regulator [Verrucomicrobiota bacterium]
MIASPSPCWNDVGNGSSQQLHDRPVREAGMNVFIHEFKGREDVDWGRDFEPDTVDICLNMDGGGLLQQGSSSMKFGPSSVGYYRIGADDGADGLCNAVRHRKEQHRFAVVRFSVEHLQRQLEPHRHSLSSGVKKTVFDEAVKGSEKSMNLQSRPMRQSDREFFRSLVNPPIREEASSMFYQSKAVECLSIVFFAEKEKEDEFFCLRQRRVAMERVEKVKRLICEALDVPPTLETLGRNIGCSPFYLSRIFSETTGMTITNYLRQARVEKAAQLLESGRFNVTEAAIEVGYNSISHFSKAFKELKGCKPSDYQG